MQAEDQDDHTGDLRDAEFDDAEVEAERAEDPAEREGARAEDDEDRGEAAHEA